MSVIDAKYVLLLNKVLMRGVERESRVGSTMSLFGEIITVPLSFTTLPLLTCRKMYPAGIVGELAAFIRGCTTEAEFRAFGCNYWKGNAEVWPQNYSVPESQWQLGPIYGAQWRNWRGADGVVVDQLVNLVEGIKRDPLSRRHVLTTWQPAELDSMCLPPCHLLAQFYVTNDGELDCAVYMRSVDVVLGLPADIMLYGMLTMLIAKETGYKPGRLTMLLGDTHVYTRHIDIARQMYAEIDHPIPCCILDSDSTLFDFIPSDLEIIYNEHGDKLTFEINV